MEKALEPWPEMSKTQALLVTFEVMTPIPENFLKNFLKDIALTKEELCWTFYVLSLIEIIILI